MAEFDPDAFLAKREKRGGFDPDAFLAKTAPETAAQTFGRSAASLADTALNAITGTLDYGAYALARAAGRTPEQATAETTSPKDVVGRAFGVTGTQGYENAPLRAAGRYIGEGLQENVIQPVAGASGIPEADVGNMLNSLAMGIAPVAGKAAAPVARTVAKVPEYISQVPNVVAAVPDVARGFGGTISGRIAKPGTEPALYKQTAPIMEPAGKTHIPADVMAEYQAGRITAEQANQAAIPYTAEQIAALNRTGGNVPYSGNVAQATGALLAEPYTSFKGYLPDLALAGLGGLTTGGFGAIGLPALNLARKGVQAYNAAKTATAANELGNLKFTPLTAEQRAALSAAQVSGPVTPTAQPTATVAQPQVQPVAPQQLPRLTYSPTPSVMYGSETGIVGKTPQEVVTADLAKRYAPQPVAPVAPEAVTAPVVDVAAEQAAREAASQASKQKILDMIQARKSQQPEVPATTVQPVVPEELPAIGPAPAVTPSAEVMAAVPEMATKSLPEIRFDIKNTGKGAITTKNNIVQLDKAAYDDLAAMHGVKLDWAELGELKKGAADAREQVNKFVLDKIKEQRGPEKRGPQMRTLQKQAEAELGIGKDVELTPEIKKRLGITDTPAPAPAISPALQALLDKQKAAGNYKPPGVSEMIIDEPSAINKIKETPWLDRSDFEQTVFMHELGLDAGKEFIAKMKTPEGSVIRAVDKTLDSEAVKYADGDSFMVRKSTKNPEVYYSVFNKDGTRYEITKINDSITNIELFNDKGMIAEYNAMPNKKGSWFVVERDGDMNTMIHETEKNTAKNAITRELFKELPNTDFNAIIQEQLARAEALKKGK